jgi:SPP1 gp7 family putative phage head morphogenesis protein
MQGPVHDRVVSMVETIQYGLLDRFKDRGQAIELIVEEPSFEDDTPAYDKAQKAREQPLTRNERREILGLDPLPDYGPDKEPLGLAIDLPSMITVVGQGEEPEGQLLEGRFSHAPAPKPEPVPVVVAPPVPPPGPKPVPAKAGPLGRLRETVEKRVTPRLHKDLLAFLAEQRAEIASRIRKVDAGRVKGDTASWWQGDRWNRELAKVVAPHVAGIAGTVTAATERAMAGKADPFTERVEAELGRRTGLRIKGINETTRDAVADAIRQGFEEGLSPAEIADRIELLPAFDEARAEMVARTETGFAYNAAAVESYREFGIDSVEVIDGDGDEICAHADGAIWSLDEANADPLGASELHPGLRAALRRRQGTRPRHGDDRRRGQGCPSP